jgi:hypothetical protein
MKKNMFNNWMKTSYISLFVLNVALVLAAMATDHWWLSIAAILLSLFQIMGLKNREKIVLPASQKAKQAKARGKLSSNLYDSSDSEYEYLKTNSKPNVEATVKPMESNGSHRLSDLRLNKFCSRSRFVMKKTLVDFDGKEPADKLTWFINLN